MSAKQTRRLLIVAFAISLIVHAIVALRVNWPFAPPKDQVEIVRIVHTLRVSHAPTPPPHTPPPPTTAPSPTTGPTASANPSRSKGRGTGAGIPTGTVPPVATPAAATPKASATPNCAKTDTPASLLETPAPPDIAAAARGDATRGTTKVHVTLDAYGAVEQSAVVETSGNSSLDLVALQIARTARYAPATRACKPVPGDYTFMAKWIPW